jgi:hypothetical protein
MTFKIEDNNYFKTPPEVAVLKNFLMIKAWRGNV